MSQLTRRIALLPVTGGSPSYDADAAAYFAAMTTQPDATRKGLLNDLVVGLKADGAWSIFDWLVLYASHDSQSGRLNFRNPAKSHSPSNGPTFTVDRGYSGDAISAYMDWNELYSAAGNQFSLNNATAGAWCNQQSATVGNGFQLGATSASRTGITPSTTGVGAHRANSGTSTGGDNTGSRLGHRTVTRTDASNQKVFKSGALVTTGAIASSTVASGNAATLRNSASFGDDRIAAVYSGGYMSDALVASIHSRLNTYLSAIGAN